MHRSATRTALVASAVAAACLGPLASEASATVTPIGTVTFTNVGNVVFSNLATGATHTCTSSVLKGTTANPAKITFTSVTYTGCGSPGSLPSTFTATNLPWFFNGTSHASGVTTGTITGIKISYGCVDGCAATLTGPNGALGTVAATYSNITKQLKFGNGDLRIWITNAFCDPLVHNPQDPVRITATYQASPALTMTLP